MRNFIAGFVCGIMLLAASCQKTKQEFSDTLHENAEIIDVIHAPYYYRPQTIPIAIRAELTDSDHDNNFGTAVIFKCQHGRLIATTRKVYEAFRDHKGKMVNLIYHEVYRNTYYDIQKTRKQTLEHALVHYKFFEVLLK